MSNYNNIISVLDAINKEGTIPVYVPSLKIDIPFKGINTGQQKAILKAAVDNPVFQTRFTIALFKLISENCSDREAIRQFTTIDSTAIALQLRVATLGSEHILHQNNRQYKIDLGNVIDRIKTFEPVPDDVITDGKFTISVGQPLFTEQCNLEKQMREKDINDRQILSAQLADTIGDAFIGEVSKFIKEVTVNHDGKDHVLNYSTLSYAERHNILEKIPTTVIKKILKYMEQYVSKQKDILTITGVDIETNKTVDGLILLVDTSLFVIN